MSANPQPEADRLEAAADQAIAACGGDMRETIKALIVANEFLETEVSELMKAVSHAYTRGRFRAVPASSLACRHRLEEKDAPRLSDKAEYRDERPGQDTGWPPWKGGNCGNPA